ncbi:MAG TPA: hypothetical protein VMT85_12065 [Thermoanaerobaculia bacterium]|nr:hypothetical protein [Thermoanaerobaculia bacterium]
MSESDDDPRPEPAAGPYTDEEIDREFLRTQRSDALHVITRLAMLTLVFWFMGRGILVHDLSAGFLLLPLALELLLVMWVGLLLSRLVVDCELFAATAKPGLVVFWTVLMFAIISIVLAVDSGTFSLARIGPGWLSGWRTVLETGLIWALVVEVLGLVLATVPEVRRWRRVGGPFVWTSVFDVGVRFAVVLLIGFVAFFLMVILADGPGEWLLDEPRRTAWFVWGFLLCVELGGLVLGVKMHQDLKRKALEPAQAPAAA